MKENELKKLKRVELLEMLIGEMEENQKLKNLLHEQSEQLQSRRIAIDRAGSIAEAALELNGVFEAAQASAQQYLDNIQDLRDKQEAERRELLANARKEVERIMAEADDYRNQKHAEAAAYWKFVSEKVQRVIEKEQLTREQLK